MSTVLSASASPRAAWEAAREEVGGRPGLRERLARAGRELEWRFGESYAWLRGLPRAQRRRVQRRLGVGLAGAALLLALGLAPQTARAETISVGGACTLADAITAANTDTATGGCPAGSGADTLDLTVDVGLTAALPQISSQITLAGNGHTISRTSGNLRLLDVVASGDLTLQHANLSGGYTGDNGGGIQNAGTLTMEDSTLSGSAATHGGGISNNGALTIKYSTLSGNWARGGAGGAILNTGTLTIEHSTLSGNSTMMNKGGGIYNTGGRVMVRDSTISDNLGYYGGGIYSRQGTLTIQNSTLSGNRSDVAGFSYSAGGGICAMYGAVTVQNSTLSGNSAAWGGGIDLARATLILQNSTLTGTWGREDYGSGISANYGVLTVQNSIIAGQADVEDCSVWWSTLTSQGYNIESGTSCGFTGPGDLQNVSGASLNLYWLANNGGPTQTHALAAGSVAIDRVPSAACTGAPLNGLDQRGAARNVDGDGVASDHECDVGAFEFPVLNLHLAASGPPEVTLSWNALPVTEYQVWRSPAPFAGYTLYQDHLTTTSLAVGVDPLVDYYYEVRGVGGAAPVVSNRIGVLSFALVPGS
jgi:hypothetical protein